jgi:hypothetical protein
MDAVRTEDIRWFRRERVYVGLARTSSPIHQKKTPPRHLHLPKSATIRQSENVRGQYVSVRPRCQDGLSRLDNTFDSIRRIPPKLPGIPTERAKRLVRQFLEHLPHSLYQIINDYS